MERLITLWQNLTTEQLVIGLLIFAVMYLFTALKTVSHQYHQHDKLLLVLGHVVKDKLGITTVKIHRSGDFEIVQPLNGDE